MQKEIRLYIISYAFYEIARTIPHAFVTAYLLTMGLNISQITFAQVFFMIAIVVLEIPSGMICDRYNKKYVFITAYVFMICSYYIYASVNCLFTLIMAQIFYGIAMSLKSGSIDCIILNRLYLEQKEKIEDFIRWNNLTGTLSMLIGASIGSFLYTKILNNRVYFVAIAFFLISSIFCVKMQNEINRVPINIQTVKLKDLKEQFLFSIRTLFGDKKLLFLVSIIGSLQFMAQPLFNYWQPISMEIGIKEDCLIFVYIVIQIISLFALMFYKKLVISQTTKDVIMQFIGAELLLMALGWLCREKIFILVMLLTIIPRVCIGARM